MQKRKKQLLGLSGLAIVGIVTAVALAMPANAEGSDPEVRDGAVQVQVTVESSRVDVHIVSPKAGETITEGKTQFTLTASRAKTIQPYLSYIDAQGVKQEIALPVIDAEGKTTITGELNLPTAETEYTLRVVATNVNGVTASDEVTFTYRAVSVVSKGESAENADPIIHITANSTVNKLQIQAYTQGGDPMPVFVNSDGTQEAIILGRDALDEYGHVMVTLPFTKYNAKAGTYDVVVVAYDAEGNVISVNRVTVEYKPKTPEVPGTGSMILDNLNISQMDYLLTGLIAFGAVAGFAIFLVFRKNRR